MANRQAGQAPMQAGQAPMQAGQAPMQERVKQTLVTQQQSGVRAASNTGPPVTQQLRTTRWSAERDHVGQRFREGFLGLPLQEGHVVVLKSDKWTPGYTGIQDCSININDSAGNVLFHFNPRGWSRTIVMNTSRVNVGWGPEEIIRNLDQFKANSPNTIAIVNNSGNFEVYVNKTFVYRYQKRSTTDVAKIEYRWRGNSFLSDPLTMTVHDSVSQYLA